MLSGFMIDATATIVELHDLSKRELQFLVLCHVSPGPQGLEWTREYDRLVSVGIVVPQK